MEEQTTEVLEVEGSETETTEISYVCDCEHIDYTEQLETLILQNEYLANSNAQLVTNDLFAISFVCGFGVCFILYKFLKIFL